MVFKRMRDIVTATIHEGLDKIENPQVMLKQYLRDVDSEISKAKHTIIKQQTLEKGFQSKMMEAEKLAGKRQTQAQLAFDAGEEDLARKALAEMKHFQAKTAEYKSLYEKAGEQVQELRGQLSQLEEKYEDLKDKKYALVARANAAKAKQHIQSSINRIDSESTFKEVKRLEERITEMEIKANAYARSSNASDNQFIAFEYADEAEKELEKMRQAKGNTTEVDQGAKGSGKKAN
ncbi:phage shock protein A (PspA) family protein [Scopulibacillus darangshiensis]|uniref:Phage shock protein A (PspA) family protein n=1 Tax=Scopulibacillus darangshiensis TaxID=442528 RepID=A0A4R2NC95_9BACL|nr:PspA/IM30 family protein [Scopulibacillus darangshiensis]TCP18632.1 phage shock protein A (PspA) family protein [Scopulibacillus darangshiensis]